MLQWRKNTLGFSHVVCCACDYHAAFYVRTEEIDGVVTFHSLVCTKCNNAIYVDLKPVFAKEDRL